MTEVASAHDRYSWLPAALDDEQNLVLTASRRLARELRGVHAASMCRAGHTAWLTPQIFDWRDWSRRMLLETATRDAPRPVSAAASDVLWERCLSDVSGHSPDDDIATIASLARQAAMTWRRLVEWQVPAKAVMRTARSRDERVYAAALERYLVELDGSGAIDPACIPALLADRLGDDVHLPRRVTVVGFDRLSPLADKLLRALEAGNVDVTRLRWQSVRLPERIHSYIDEDAELRAAGHWARSIAETNPAARIGIVVAQLEDGTQRTARLIRDGFEPAQHCSESPDRTSIEISYGQHLNNYPAVSIALLCLNFATGNLGSAQISVLLRTDWLALGDLSQRAVLERKLRQLPDRRWTPASLAEVSRGLLQEDELDAWLALLGRFSKIALRAEDGELPSAWAPFINSLLTESGWSTERQLSSNEFQLMNRWRELLNELAELDDVLGEQSLRSVVQRLHRLAASTVFQPEREDAQVQVMGPLEAAGLEFDELWIARCDADRWPAVGQPSPLVSRALQIKHGMPDATPTDTLAYSRRVLERLAASAAAVRFSWSRTKLDAASLVSPLLPLPPSDGSPEQQSPPDPGWFGEQLVGSAQLHLAATDPVPSVGDGESLRGGARIVAWQRTEPFSAFTLGRLGVRELDRFRTGLPASLRGSMIHDALQRLYADKPGRARIESWGAEERQRRITAALDRAMAVHEQRADAVLRRLLALERYRMQSLLLHVLESDTERKEFSIEAVEQALEFRYAGVHLQLRLDRVDRLADQTRLIIDYKTGRRRGLIKRDGDPSDLQLVVYAAALDEAVGGLSLFYVHSHGVVHSAAGASIDWKPVSSQEWSDKLGRWKGEVFAAVEQIAKGDVRVNLRGDAQRGAQLNVLCRSAELKRVD